MPPLFFTIVTIKQEHFQLETPKFLDTYGLIIEVLSQIFMLIVYN